MIINIICALKDFLSKPYIVDFYCSSDKLIIELDGDPHGDYSQIQIDEKRDKLFEDMGCKVLRFENRFAF
ncbi:MAG: endonuclease domain-containing protein [Bacteroidales bacterium]|nr:endonuclease domain-containing protein [Bacteroidales bacterium]